MGMSAEVIAIGKYSREITKYLEYPEMTYSHTNIGAPIIRVLFGISEGSSLSREFASLLGVTDPWDFNQHKLDPKAFNRQGLIEFVEVYDDYREDLDALFAFVDAGFEFYFMPNG